ncbi:type II toxin-antitoxin system RelE/ParE family toxin [Rhizobium sp. G21]|uniref:type II toxin-antitoxin system RelE/ParE family toxin n=1 Tax=Rhizobium sp. G21 TaxID=2758439 RepID=UPI0015FF0FD8|nr:type II toxin-antitoxin system RelE/ParE family toxin [Rhizobium sp. G21]MBB1248273.1 type II toxin-antitoxin system RelE/ParE family toxin [Rhizobium sp. G21]
MRKRIVWMGLSFDDIREFPAAARRQAGHDLNLIQAGLPPMDWKAFSTVGPGAYEIRIKSDDNQYRVFYVAKFEEAIYVLHCFVKKSRKTAAFDVEIGQQRYKAMKKLREQMKEGA